jgi:hypothetical protein
VIAETEKPSDMTSATAGPAATVVVVVVDDDVVVVVGAVTVILDFPMMSGCPLTGPKILPSHWPVGASGDIRNRNV